MLKIFLSRFLAHQNLCQFKKKSDFCTRFSRKKARINNVNKQQKL